MKKLFTLALALSMAFVGYSQVRTVSNKEDMKKVATMQQSTGRESFENVQSQPNMTRSDGELDYSTYDWQSNAGARTWTIAWPDGKVNFAYTMATTSNFSDRGTGIGTYDAVNDEWIPGESRVESEKTGFGSIARYGEKGIIVAAHTATQCGVYMIEDKDAINYGGVSAVSYLDPTYDPCWPSVMTSGPGRDIIHVVVTANGADGSTLSVPGAEGANNPIIYFRSKDGGQTWDKQNVILPYMGTEYGLDWGSNIAYWMETTEDNCLTLVVNNAWSDCFALCSYDDGETWEKKTFWQHYGVNTGLADDWFMYPRWTSAQWGAYGLSLAFEFNGSTGDPGSGSYYPSLGGVGFWAENIPYPGDGSSTATWGSDPNNPMPPVPGQPFIMDTAYVYNDIYAAWPRWSDQTYDNPLYFGYVTPLTDDGEVEPWEEALEFNIEDFSLHGSYNSGCSGMPVLATVPGSNGWDMVAVWSAMDENHQDGNGNFFYKLFASYSADGGKTWETQKHITNDFMLSYTECVYTQAAVVGTTLVVATQADGETGTFVQSDDTDETDNYYLGLTFELEDLFPGVNVGTEEYVSHNTHMTVYPNPATDRVSVILSQNSEVVIYNLMGQAIRTVEGRVGANTIDLSGLNAGVYFISAGSDTQKFVVK
jgi:hypothetical protein